MEVITVEHTAFKKIEAMFQDVCKQLSDQVKENTALKAKKLLTAREVGEMTGYHEETIKRKKHEIGFKSDGGTLKFPTNLVDAWIEKDVIKPRK